MHWRRSGHTKRWCDICGRGQNLGNGAMKERRRTTPIGRGEMESSVLKVKEGEGFRNEFSLVRKHRSEVKTRLPSQTLEVKSSLCALLAV